MICATWSRAVALLHVADHLVAPVLAEVDVEVGHRHALGIEEALEQQAEADRIEIGDGERIGDERARARAAARPDRNALRLRPFDEVGDDQEVARDISCPSMTPSSKASRSRIGLLVVPRRQAMRGDPLLEALLGCAQLRRSSAPSRRRLAPSGSAAGSAGAARPEGAALRDLDRVVERLGQIGEQRRHLGAVLK